MVLLKKTIINKTIYFGIFLTDLLNVAEFKFPFDDRVQIPAAAAFK